MHFSRVLCTTTTALLALGSIASGQTTTTLEFENAGIEAGITFSGASTFSIAGSNWTGGVVVTQFIPPLYSSGGFSYIPLGASNMDVFFDNHIDQVSFFFVHGFGNPAGVAQFYDTSGTIIGTANSNAPTFFNDPGNFVTFNGTDIARVEFTGGVVDGFSYRTSDDCTVAGSLCGDRHLISLSGGGSQVLSLDGGAALNGHIYVMLGSVTGTSPGFPIGGQTLPLVFDAYFLLTLTDPFATLTGAFGALSPLGTGTTTFTIPPGANPNFAGLDFFHAFVSFDPLFFFTSHTSNPETATMVP